MRQRVVGLAVQVQSRCVFRVRQFGAAALPPFAGNFRLCEGLALSLLAQYAPRRCREGVGRASQRDSDHIIERGKKTLPLDRSLDVDDRGKIHHARRLTTLPPVCASATLSLPGPALTHCAPGASRLTRFSARGAPLCMYLFVPCMGPLCQIGPGINCFIIAQRADFVVLSRMF